MQQAALQRPPPDFAQSPNKPAVGLYADDLTTAMRSELGVVSVQSYCAMLCRYNHGYNEDYPKMNAVPIDPENHGAVSVDVDRSGRGDDPHGDHAYDRCGERGASRR